MPIGICICARPLAANKRDAAKTLEVMDRKRSAIERMGENRLTGCYSGLYAAEFVCRG